MFFFRIIHFPIVLSFLMYSLVVGRVLSWSGYGFLTQTLLKACNDTDPECNEEGEGEIGLVTPLGAPPKGVEKDRLKGSVVVGRREGVAVGVAPTNELVE